MNKLIKKVNQEVNNKKNDILKFLSEYVSHQSVNPTIDSRYSEKKCQKWLFNEIKSWKCFSKYDIWEEKKDRPNILVKLGKKDTKNDLMYFGHTDVVPVEEATINKWTMNPWGGEIKNNRLFGRGSCDMKAGNTAFLWAMKIISELGIEIKNNIYGSVVIAEESGEYNIGVNSIIKRGYNPAFTICAEPTDMEICNISPGAYFLKLIVNGKAIHTSQKYKCVFPRDNSPGIDAISKAIKYIEGFNKLDRKWYKQDNKMIPNGLQNLTPTLMKGGEYIVALPERCEIIFSGWHNPDNTITEIRSQLEKTVKKISDKDAWLKNNPPIIEMPPKELPVTVPPIEVSNNNKYCKQLFNSYKTIIGKKPKFGVFTAASDLSWLKLLNKIGILFGPGNLADGVHGIDESVSIQQVIDCCKVYAINIINCQDDKN